jgi:hypothetical protein
VLAEMMGSTSNEAELSSDNVGVDIDWMDAENSADIVGVEVDWVLSDELENQVHDDAHLRVIQRMQHGAWRQIPHSMKDKLSHYTKGVLTKY